MIDERVTMAAERLAQPMTDEERDRALRGWRREQERQQKAWREGQRR